MRARKSLLTTLVSLCALVSGLTLGSANSQATVTHQYLSQISGVSGEGPFTQLTGISVDAGDLYLVAGSGSDTRIDKFDATTDALVTQFAAFPPSSLPDLSDFHQGLAVGHGAGETEEYVAGDENTSEGPAGRVAVFDAAGNLQQLWTGADTPSPFGCDECGGYGGVAADDSGNPLTNGLVYVLDPAHDVVDVFEPKVGGGERYVTQLTGPEPGIPFAGLGAGVAESLAVDQSSGDVLVLDGEQAVDVFEPKAFGEYTLLRRLTGTPAGSFERLSGVAADGGNGDVYVVEGEAGIVDQFNSSGAYVGHLTGVGTPAGSFGSVVSVAVAPSSHDLYVAELATLDEERAPVVDVFGPSLVIPDVGSESASSVKEQSATLNGTVSPDEAGSASCQFEWGTSVSFGEVTPCEPESVPDGGGTVAVHAALAGLQPDTTYYYRLLASNANGTNPGEASQDQTFTTSGPGIHEESASSVTATSATLGTRIDPNNAATTYYFQYGTGSGYGTSVPAAPGLSLGSGKGDLAVSVHLQGLAAGTVYHYRVVALSEPSGEPLAVDGMDETFTTQGTNDEITQPDGRQWEMVSPPNKQGAGILAIGWGQGDDIQAAADGGGITYGADSPFVANPAGSRSLEVTQVISRRQVPGGWETADITTAHNEKGPAAPAIGRAAEYKLFSSDLSLGLVEPDGDTPLPPLPAGSEKTIYFREADGAYKALITSANVPHNIKFGGDGQDAGEVEFVSASPDLSHVVVNSRVALVAGAPSEGGLYEWVGGQLRLVSVLPNHEPTAHGKLGEDGNAINGVVRHAISNDGSRIVWRAADERLYLRDMTREETLQVDAAQDGLPESNAAEHYATASSDDSRVFFTSARHLTAGSASNSEDLYAFEITSRDGEPLAGKPTDLTPEDASEGAGVQGVIGASEDGSYVYFVAGGLLGDAVAHGAEGGHYLYMDHYEAGTKTWSAPQFIASLSQYDSQTWGNGEHQDLVNMTSRVSPDGRYLAFMSEESLTGYQNRDLNSDVPDEEVFLYDAGTGKVVCASCNPTGGRPLGLEVGGLVNERLVDYPENWNNRWLAANIPGWTSKSILAALYQSRYLSDSGRLFFNSVDELVPADVNGKADVYEYEPDGVGSCQGSTHGQSASVVFDEKSGGCIGLISSGTSSEESVFMDASETGADVFFLTLSRLAPQDDDTSFDMYDAHECTASAPCAPPIALAPLPCTTGDACKPAPTSQPTLFGAPSSETFSGAGNVGPSAGEAGVKVKAKEGAVQKLAEALRACGKKPKPKRARCERQARRRLGAKPSRVERELVRRDQALRARGRR
jgi:WD40-like Beta Propeller Repeat